MPGAIPKSGERKVGQDCGEVLMSLWVIVGIGGVGWGWQVCLRAGGWRAKTVVGRKSTALGLGQAAGLCQPQRCTPNI